jgi:hypothetical protein
MRKMRRRRGSGKWTLSAGLDVAVLISGVVPTVVSGRFKGLSASLEGLVSASERA